MAFKFNPREKKPNKSLSYKATAVLNNKRRGKMREFTGNDLKLIRKAEQKTQKEMAEYFRITRGTYSCWESRYKNRPVPRKRHIAQFYVLEKRYFPEITVTLVTDTIWSKIRRLWKKIRRLNK